MKRKPEYIEGQRAKDNFDRFTSAILQVPKAGARKHAKAKKAAKRRKASGSDKG
jgi:hypothetical protein